MIGKPTSCLPLHHAPRIGPTNLGPISYNGDRFYRFAQVYFFNHLLWMDDLFIDSVVLNWYCPRMLLPIIALWILWNFTWSWGLFLHNLISTRWLISLFLYRNRVTLSRCMCLVSTQSMFAKRDWRSEPQKVILGLSWVMWVSDMR